MKKGHPLFPSNPPLKVEVPSSAPFLKISLEFHPPSRKEGWGGAHYGLKPFGWLQSQLNFHLSETDQKPILKKVP